MEKADGLSGVLVSGWRRDFIKIIERENGMVRNVADIYQSGQYSIEAQKVKRAQGALNILSNSGRQRMYCR